MDDDESESQKEGKPNPEDFYNFFPYYCLKFDLEISLEKIQDDNLVLGSAKKKQQIKSKMRMPTMGDTTSVVAPKSMTELDAEYTVRVIAKYCGDVLTQLTFRKCKTMIPWEVFRLLYTIVHFYKNLQSINIGMGIDAYCLHEISKLLKASNITEICLDGSCIPSGGYATLLVATKNLQILSLSRCKLGDEGMGEIIKNMHPPNPAYSTLYVLNVSSNQLTDETAFKIAQILRTNRKLSYLNLNGNRLTTHGAVHILNVLTKFIITDEEHKIYKEGLIKHFRTKEEIMDMFTKNYKFMASTKPQKKTRKPELFSGDLDEKEKFDKMASDYADSQLGEFEHPFHPPIKDENRIWCAGNNTLGYLGLAYNSITHPFQLKLLEVIQYQKLTFFNKRQKGLVNIKIEGNPLPTGSPELRDVDNILTMNLVNLSRTRKSIVGRPKKN